MTAIARPLVPWWWRRTSWLRPRGLSRSEYRLLRRPGGYTTVSSIAALKTALADDTLDEITVADGTYSCVNATSEAATSLFWGEAYASRTRPVVVRATTQGGVTFDGGGATCGMYFGEGVHHLTFDGFRFANWVPVSSGVIVIGRHGAVETAPHDLALKNITVLGTCLGSNSPGEFLDHAFYVSSAANPGPHDIRIADCSVVAPADTTRLLHSAIHMFGTENGSETTGWNVTVERFTATAKDGMLVWGAAIHDCAFTDATFTSCSVFGARQQYADTNMAYLRCTSTGSGSQGFYSPVGTPTDHDAPSGTTFTGCSFA